MNESNREDENFETRMAPGRYYVGDPCYVIRGDNWDELLQIAGIDSGDFTEGELNFKGETLWMHSTYHGDGAFVGTNGQEYGVDSGTIGVVPVCLMDVTEEDAQKDGSIIEFKKSFFVSYEDGTYKIDDIEIYTGEEDEEEYCENCGMFSSRCSCEDFCHECGTDPCTCDDEDVCHKCGEDPCTCDEENDEDVFEGDDRYYGHCGECGQPESQCTCGDKPIDESSSWRSNVINSTKDALRRIEAAMESQSECDEARVNEYIAEIKKFEDNLEEILDGIMGNSHGDRREHELNESDKDK